MKNNPFKCIIHFSFNSLMYLRIFVLLISITDIKLLKKQDRMYMQVHNDTGIYDITTKTNLQNT